MKTIICLSLICLLFTVSTVDGWEGYTNRPMQGNLIFPLNVSHAEISEIKLEIQRLGNYGSDTKVKMEYILKNTDIGESQIKVAFPILSNCLGDCTQIPDDFKVFVNNESVSFSAEKMRLKDYYLRIYSKLKPAISKRKYLKNQGIIDKDYDMTLFYWNISLRGKETISLVCEYSLEVYLDPGVETLYFDFNPLSLWEKVPSKMSLRLTLPEELMDHLRKPAPSKWPQVSIKPNAHKIVRDTLEWTYSRKTIKNIGYLWLTVDYRAPGVEGE